MCFFCSLTKGITPKICRLCVYVLKNKCSFEPFMCLDLFGCRFSVLGGMLLVFVDDDVTAGVLVLMAVVCVGVSVGDDVGVGVRVDGWGCIFWCGC